MNTTRKVAEYVTEKGIKISVLSERTGISRNVLDNCFSEENTRAFRADELLDICCFLEIDPMKLRGKEGG